MITVFDPQETPNEYRIYVQYEPYEKNGITDLIMARIINLPNMIFPISILDKGTDIIRDLMRELIERHNKYNLPIPWLNEFEIPRNLDMEIFVLKV